VRLEAEKRLQKRMYGEWSGLFFTSGILLSPFMLLVSIYTVFLIPPLAAVLAKPYAKLKKQSAIGVYAQRRQRVSKELGVDVQVDQMQPRALSSGTDPEILDMEPLLAWLGAKLED